MRTISTVIVRNHPATLLLEIGIFEGSQLTAGQLVCDSNTIILKCLIQMNGITQIDRRVGGRHWLLGGLNQRQQWFDWSGLPSRWRVGQCCIHSVHRLYLRRDERR